MIEYVKLRQEHIALVAAQEGDKQTQLAYLDPALRTALENEFSFTAFCGNKCLGAAGIIRVTNRRAMAWAMLSREAGPHMMALTRKVKRALELHPCPRVEMTVLCDFEPGHRWARLLGMDLEAPRMRGSSASGLDEALYARVRG